MIKARLPFKREGESDGGGGVGSLLRFAAIAVVVAIAIIAIGEASRSCDASRAIAPVTATIDPPAGDLARCRKATPEQFASDDSCRRIWAENRRRFFAPIAPTAQTTGRPSNAQDRIPMLASPIASEEAR